MNEIQKLIEIYENLDGLNSQSIRLKLKEVIEELKNYQSKENKWISIGQYPTEPCLLCFENGEMLIGYYDEWEDSYICGGYVISREPIAWQPLPEPYKENEGD